VVPRARAEEAFEAVAERGHVRRRGAGEDEEDAAHGRGQLAERVQLPDARLPRYGLWGGGGFLCARYTCRVEGFGFRRSGCRSPVRKGGQGVGCRVQGVGCRV